MGDRRGQIIDSDGVQMVRWCPKCDIFGKGSAGTQREHIAVSVVGKYLLHAYFYDVSLLAFLSKIWHFPLSTGGNSERPVYIYPLNPSKHYKTESPR